MFGCGWDVVPGCGCNGWELWYRPGDGVHGEVVVKVKSASGRSIKRLVVFLLPLGWDVGPSQGHPQHYIRRYPSIHPGR